jgi:hypothetical protein
MFEPFSRLPNPWRALPRSSGRWPGRLLAISLILSGVPACAAAPAASAAPPASAPAIPLTQHQGFQGFWLRSDTTEAFIALQPKFRILSLRSPGQSSLLADPRVTEQGIRLAYAEPDQVPTSFDVGNQPAEVLQQPPHSVRLRLAPAAGLRYSVEVSLRNDRPGLQLDCALENVGTQPRRIACWAVAAFTRDGHFIVPFGKAPRSRRRLVLSWWTQWPQTGVHVGRDTLLIDAAAPVQGTAYKIGIITNSGWGAFVREGHVLLSAAPFDPAAAYPEDGANLTIFQSNGGPQSWCELEQLGRLGKIEPGQSARLSETFELFAITPPPPSAPPNPDAWRATIEKAAPPASTQPSTQSSH